LEFVLDGLSKQPLKNERQVEPNGSIPRTRIEASCLLHLIQPVHERVPMNAQCISSGRERTVGSEKAMDRFPQLASGFSCDREEPAQDPLDKEASIFW
jgi:hypothetical protein